MSKIYIDEDGSKYILVRYITRNGVRIYLFYNPAPMGTGKKEKT